MEPKLALEAAIEDCIEQDILTEFLRKYRAEVLGMLLEEFDVKKYERSIREEGREEGIEIGREEGREEGIEIGREEGREEGIEIGLEKGRKEGIEVGREAGREEESARYSKLISILLEQHREHDLRRTAEDPEYREQLYQEFGLLKKRD